MADRNDEVGLKTCESLGMYQRVNVLRPGHDVEKERPIKLAGGVFERARDVLRRRVKLQGQHGQAGRTGCGQRRRRSGCQLLKAAGTGGTHGTGTVRTNGSDLLEPTLRHLG